MGWFAFDEERWPELAEKLTRLAVLEGKPWAWSEILMDLRYWGDQARRQDGKPRPGRVALVRRWNCTDWTAKRALKAEAEWADPTWTTPPPEFRLSSASDPPADHQPDNGSTPKKSRKPPARRLRSTSQSPDYRPARDLYTDPPDTSHQNKDMSDSPPATSDPFEVSAARWKAISPGGPAPVKGRGQGVDLNARLKSHGLEAVLEVLDWADTSDHDRAVFLRERGLSLTTLMRLKNFEAYLGFARTPPPGRARGDPAKRGAHPLREYEPTAEDLAAFDAFETPST